MFSVDIPLCQTFSLEADVGLPVSDVPQSAGVEDFVPVHGRGPSWRQSEMSNMRRLYTLEHSFERTF